MIVGAVGLLMTALYYILFNICRRINNINAWINQSYTGFWRAIWPTEVCKTGFLAITELDASSDKWRFIEVANTKSKNRLQSITIRDSNTKHGRQNLTKYQIT